MALVKPDPNFEAAGFFVLRTPLLPLDAWLAWGDAAKRDRADLRRRLAEHLQSPEAREALFVASPSLFERLPAWEAGGEAAEEIEPALVRYFARMTGRSTPFGLFAGCSVGQLGRRTSLRLEEAAAGRRQARLDMHYVCGLAETLCVSPELTHLLTVRPNSSLDRVAGRWRYVEARIEPQTRARSYFLVSVETTPYLDLTLERAARGAAPRSLAEALLDEEVSLAEASEFIASLIASQILVSDLEPAVTETEPLGPMSGKLKEHAATSWIAERLEAVSEEIRGLNALPLGLPPERYRAVARRLEGLPYPAELPRLFQVDLIKPTREASLGPRVITELGRAAELLRRICRPGPAEEALAKFRRDFEERYEGRETPLCEVLDEEHGIGFGEAGGERGDPSPLLQGLEFPSAQESRLPWGARETLLLAKLEEAARTHSTRVELTPHDLARLEAPNAPPLPDSFAVVARLAAASEQAVERGEFQLLVQGAHGPSGAVMLGRFCHADASLQRLVEAYLRAEEQLRPDAVFAEILHLPQGRLGNFICRPRLRPYEIPYLGRPSADEPSTIPVSDLRVSLAGDRIVLRSARLNREVLPRMSNAHNYGIADSGLYRFLCALMSQGVAGTLAWSWGPLEQSAFLPRIEAGKLVLSLARWRLEKPELESLREKDALARLRELRRLPRFVCLAEGDNLLPVDLENPLSAESLISLVQRRDSASLIEMFPPPDQLLAQSPEGRHTHELVVPFLKKSAGPGLPSPGGVQGQRPWAGARSFPPGSEWLYLKLYTGAATVDQLLRELLAPFLRAHPLPEPGQWFFIRYGDPAWHLRLRFHGEPARLFPELWPALREELEPWLRDGRVWKLQLDTYQREVERYGGPAAIELAEALFWADSVAALGVVETLSGDGAADARWRLALVGMDRLLEDLGFDLERKRRLLRQIRQAFGREFREDGKLRGQLGARFTAERAALEELLDPDPDRSGASGLGPGLRLFEERSGRLRRACSELAGHPALEALAGSFLHMHANRMLRSAHRAQELAIYDLLHRTYEARAARGR